MATRAEIEKKRGIERDNQGRIIRSKEWTTGRIAYLNQKLDDLKNRTKNIKAEIKAREKELENN